MTKQFTNTDIAKIDWAKADRARMLRPLNGIRSQRLSPPAPSVWGVDVACSDRRSVRASLSGAGGFRAVWWNVFSAAYMAIVADATLERAMFAFHRFHHSATLSRLRFARSVTITANDIRNNGIVAATCQAAARRNEV